ncbi:MAG: T9SS type A sorting domain-containing protein, partial [Saprospiraceae bacterium]|nr:T9SS type A sorting domain-containing protein [Saprospiraceae bacterium]
VIDRISFLLQESTNSDLFDNSGFTPKSLTYSTPEFLTRPLQTSKRTMVDSMSITIELSQGNTLFEVGDTAEFTLIGSENITHIVILIEESKYNFRRSEQVGNEVTFMYPVNNNSSLGNKRVFAIGYNENADTLVIDSSLIINVVNNSELDTIYCNPFYSTVQQGTNFSINVIASHVDGNKNIISNLDSVVYSSINGNTSSITNNVFQGSFLGKDTIEVVYKGIKSSFIIDVVEPYSEPILPLNLLSFNAEFDQKSKVELTWKTTNEIHVSHFEIQKSGSSIQGFKKIDSVYAKGNSLQIREYNYHDLINQDGQYYYRLKIVDLDGSFRYSNIVDVNAFKLTDKSLSLFPNPSKGLFSISRSRQDRYEYQIELFDIAGQKLYSDIFYKNVQKIEFDITNLATGIYFINAINRTLNVREVIKLVKTN